MITSMFDNKFGFVNYTQANQVSIKSDFPGDYPS